MSSDLLRESTCWQFQHPTCWWGYPPILSSELLTESINFVIQPTEESTQVYISYIWLSFKYNCTYKTWSLGNVTHLDPMKPLKATSRFLAHTWTIVLVPEYVSSCQHLFADHFPDAKLSWSNPIELRNWSKTTKFGIDTGPKRNRRVTRRRRKNYSDNGCSTAPSSGYHKAFKPYHNFYSLSRWLKREVGLECWKPFYHMSGIQNTQIILKSMKWARPTKGQQLSLFLVIRFSTSNVTSCLRKFSH